MTDFARCFSYDAWANRRTLKALEQIANLELRPRQIMAHLVSAQKVWLTRLSGERAITPAIWPELTLQDCARFLDENERASEHLLQVLPEHRLTELVTYRNSAGVEFRTAIADILTQVLLHGSYHRGQLATAIKDHGGNPPNTDYITYTREH